MRELQGGRRLAARLAGLGLTPGALVAVVHNYGRGPLTVSVLHTRRRARNETGSQGDGGDHRGRAVSVERAAVVTLALAGQPNVGKSTVFNRLTGLEPARGQLARQDGGAEDRRDGLRGYADPPRGPSRHLQPHRQLRGGARRPGLHPAGAPRRRGGDRQRGGAGAQPVPPRRAARAAAAGGDRPQHDGRGREPGHPGRARGAGGRPQGAGGTLVASRNQGLLPLVAAALRVAADPGAFAPVRPEIRPAHRPVLDQIAAQLAGKLPSLYPTDWAALKLLEGDAEIAAVVRGDGAGGVGGYPPLAPEARGRLPRHRRRPLRVDRPHGARRGRPPQGRGRHRDRPPRSRGDPSAVGPGAAPGRARRRLLADLHGGHAAGERSSAG